jgi:NAD(P)-dependent dehydrogenase (short-subunit alcohol dehydrogenase family)
MQTLKNQVILVTDATDGLGRRVARDQAALEATILLHERSREVFPKDCQKAYDLGATLAKKPDYWDRIGPEESES